MEVQMFSRAANLRAPLTLFLQTDYVSGRPTLVHSGGVFDPGSAAAAVCSPFLDVSTATARLADAWMGLSLCRSEGSEVKG